MDRSEARRADRRRLAVALGASVAIHALVLWRGTLELPSAETAPRGRGLEVVELPDAWRDAALEIVTLETVRSARSGGAAAPAGERATSVPAREKTASLPARTAVPALVTAPVAVAERPVLDLAPAADPAMPVPDPAYARSGRGIVSRTDAPGAEFGGIELTAASAAARDAEREERREDGRGRGIGISIRGPGMGGSCPGGLVPAIGIGGGLSGVPTIGKGKGIIGARPPNAGAINRSAPPRPGGR